MFLVKEKVSLLIKRCPHFRSVPREGSTVLQSEDKLTNWRWRSPQTKYIIVVNTDRKEREREREQGNKNDTNSIRFRTYKCGFHIHYPQTNIRTSNNSPSFSVSLMPWNMSMVRDMHLGDFWSSVHFSVHESTVMESTVHIFWREKHLQLAAIRDSAVFYCLPPSPPPSLLPRCLLERNIGSQHGRTDGRREVIGQTQNGIHVNYIFLFGWWSWR